MKIRALLLSLVIACGGGKPVPPPSEPAARPAPLAQEPAARPAPAPAPAPPPPAPPAGKPRTDLISRAILFGNPERAGVQLSPDGKRIAWIAPKDGVLNVHVAPVGKLDQARAITSDTARPIRQYFWTYDGTHVLYPQDAAGDENFHLFRTTADGGQVTDLTPYKGARAVVLGVSEVFALDLATGKRTLVYENMKQHQLPVTYAVFPDEGHGFERPENNIAFFGVAEAFLSAHLGGFYLPMTAEELAASSIQIKEGRTGIPGLPN